ncbi:MAG: ATP-binding cassette, subfamily bacterial [Mycobacterium sp.]|nr:ATP-binding cassette, subfamily bacterial [Mycobacterium sp.]
MKIDAADPFVPLTVEPRYRPPKNTIDPDRNKSWLRRALPIVFAHKAIFLTSLGGSFIALIIQVQIPDLVKQAIDKALTPGTKAVSQVNVGLLHHFVLIIAILALARGVISYVARLFLFETAYNIEYDLRNIIYEHLTRLSFPFYDRVQTGQLISRANSDIRSVQMYLSFAPSIIVQCAIAVVAFAYMLRINAPLACVAMITMPFVYFVGVKMRGLMFPVSWLIQSRLAEVATIVDENVNGVRVVKSFAAEGEQLKSLDKAAERVQWANIKDADIRARWSPTMENLPRLGLALVLLYGGWLALHGHATVGTIVAFNSYVLMLQPPFRMLGMLIMMGQRAAASADRIYEILD